VAVVEFWGKLDHRNLPSQAQEPHEGENERHSVKLMMDQLVVLIDLEDEGVVDVVAAEDLHSEAARVEDEADDCREIIGVHSSVYLVPVRACCLWTDRQEDEEAEQHDQAAAKEANQIGVFAAHVVVLGVELRFGLPQVALAEAISVESEQVLRQDLQLARHLALLHFETHFIDFTAKLLVDRVIPQRKKVLSELFHNFTEGKLIDLTV